MDFFTQKFGNPAGTFIIYSVICGICIIFIWRLLPETKDKSLEEIGEFWLKKGESSEANTKPEIINEK